MKKEYNFKVITKTFLKICDSIYEIAYPPPFFYIFTHIVNLLHIAASGGKFPILNVLNQLRKASKIKPAHFGILSQPFSFSSSMIDVLKQARIR